MRKLASILFLFLLLLQAIPVLHFFAEKKAVFYAYVDEEKPEQKSKAEKEVYHSQTDLLLYPPPEKELSRLFSLFVHKHHLSPFLDSLTRPPDAC